MNKLNTECVCFLQVEKETPSELLERAKLEVANKLMDKMDLILSNLKEYNIYLDAKIKT